MQIDITKIILAVIALLGAVVTTFFVPWLKTKLSAEKRIELQEWVRLAVEAAEQIFTGSGRGVQKKQYVMDWLEQRGISFDVEVIDAAIEAAVYDMNTGFTGELLEPLQLETLLEADANAETEGLHDGKDSTGAC